MVAPVPAQISKLPRRKLSCPSRPSSRNSCRLIFLPTLLHSHDADFYPYGGESPYTNSCSRNYKFEGKERDTETGNDDFGARYYASRLGRWLSSDWSSVPVPVPYAHLTNPQTFNLYAMVSDNPVSFADLDGHCGSSGESGSCGIFDDMSGFIYPTNCLVVF